MVGQPGLHTLCGDASLQDSLLLWRGLLGLDIEARIESSVSVTEAMSLRTPAGEILSSIGISRQLPGRTKVFSTDHIEFLVPSTPDLILKPEHVFNFFGRG